MLIATKIKAMFKFKRESKINPKVGMYFFYGGQTESNILKIVKVSKGYINAAWWSETHRKCLITSGTEITTFIKAVIDEKYIIMPEEAHYMINSELRNFVWEG